MPALMFDHRDRSAPHKLHFFKSFFNNPYKIFEILCYIWHILFKQCLLHLWFPLLIKHTCEPLWCWTPVGRELVLHLSWHLHRKSSSSSLPLSVLFLFICLQFSRVFYLLHVVVHVSYIALFLQFGHEAAFPPGWGFTRIAWEESLLTSSTQKHFFKSISEIITVHIN